MSPALADGFLTAGPPGKSIKENCLKPVILFWLSYYLTDGSP